MYFEIKYILQCVHDMDCNEYLNFYYNYTARDKYLLRILLWTYKEYNKVFLYIWVVQHKSKKENRKMSPTHLFPLFSKFDKVCKYLSCVLIRWYTLQNKLWVVRSHQRGDTKSNDNSFSRTFINLCWASFFKDIGHGSRNSVLAIFYCLSIYSFIECVLMSISRS